MAIHEQLRPDAAEVPYLSTLAVSNRTLDNAARTTGVIAVPSDDGTTTMIGTGFGGVAMYVGDKIAPGKPLGVNVSSRLGSLIVDWGGELEGGIPDDFLHIIVRARAVPDSNEIGTVEIGQLRSAGSLACGTFAAGTTVEVWAVAVDNAHDEQGEWTPNYSIESDRVSVEILPIVSQAQFEETADSILAAAEEDATAQVNNVNESLEQAKQDIQQNTSDLALANQAITTVQQQANEQAATIDAQSGTLTQHTSLINDAVNAAAQAQQTADGKNRIYTSKTEPDHETLTQGDLWYQVTTPLRSYWEGEPNNSVSVLETLPDQVTSINVWDGSRFVPQVLAAHEVIATDTISGRLLQGDAINGMTMVGGEFITLNGNLKINDAGLYLSKKDNAGNRTNTIVFQSETGAATFTGPVMFGATINAPTINGGELVLKDSSENAYAWLNKTGILFGNTLAYAKDARTGRWTLTVDGNIQSSGDTSAVTITGATIQTSSQPQRGVKMTSGGIVQYNTSGQPTFTLDANGNILMDGSLSANLSITSPSIVSGTVIGAVIQSDTDANLARNGNGFRLAGNNLWLYDDSAEACVQLCGAGDGALSWITGMFQTSLPSRNVDSIIISPSFTQGSIGSDNVQSGSGLVFRLKDAPYQNPYIASESYDSAKGPVSTLVINGGMRTSGESGAGTGFGAFGRIGQTRMTTSNSPEQAVVFFSANCDYAQRSADTSRRQWYATSKLNATSGDGTIAALDAYGTSSRQSRVGARVADTSSGGTYAFLESIDANGTVGVQADITNGYLFLGGFLGGYTGRGTFQATQWKAWSNATFAAHAQTATVTYTFASPAKYGKYFGVANADIGNGAMSLHVRQTGSASSIGAIGFNAGNSSYTGDLYVAFFCWLVE